MTKSAIRWFLLALAVKAALFCVFVDAYRKHPEVSGIIGGVSFLVRDTNDYYEPIEHLIDEGTYGRPSSIGWLSATRMPGFLPLYGPVYALFGRTVGHVFIIVFQLLADALAVVVLSLTAQRLFDSRPAFHTAFWVYGVSAFVSTFNPTFRSDSLCASFIVFSMFFFVRAIMDLRPKDWLLSGLFVGWATFMRPATGALIPAMLLVWILQSGRQIWTQPKNTFATVTLFLTPLVLALTVWTVRNYVALARFVPATTTNDEFFHGEPQRRALWKIIPAWGAELNTWDTGTAYRWFLPRSDPFFDPDRVDDNPFDPATFTPDYGLAELKALRALYWKSYDPAVTDRERTAAAVEVVQRVDLYLKSYRRHHPLYYAVIANLRLVRQMLFVTHTYALPFVGKTPGQRVIRGFFFLLYYLSLIGWVGGGVLAIIRKNRLAILLLFLPITHVAIHAVVIGWVQNWYLAPVYPLFVLNLSSLTAMVSERT